MTDDRQQRLAAALRANLRRRKAAAGADALPPGGPEAATSPAQDAPERVPRPGPPAGSADPKS